MTQNSKKCSLGKYYISKKVTDKILLSPILKLVFALYRKTLDLAFECQMTMVIGGGAASIKLGYDPETDDFTLVLNGQPFESYPTMHPLFSKYPDSSNS